MDYDLEIGEDGIKYKGIFSQKDQAPYAAANYKMPPGGGMVFP
jgi:hypothetical protein